MGLGSEAFDDEIGGDKLLEVSKEEDRARGGSVAAKNLPRYPSRARRDKAVE